MTGVTVTAVSVFRMDDGLHIGHLTFVPSLSEIRFIPLVLFLLLSSCSLLIERPHPFTQAERDELMLDQAPLRFPVQVYWNENRIPCIVAENDEDLATVIGVVHAHLRGDQLQIFRRIVNGRLAESVGPAAVDLDHTLRILNIGKAADQMIVEMEPSSRRFAEAYLAGVNYYILHRPQEWPDLRAMNIAVEPFALKDLVSIWRLFSVDVNWFRIFQVLSEARESGVAVEKVWAERLEMQARSDPGVERLATLLNSVSRSGSNSLVLAPSRSVNGSGMIASDPHVGLFLPSLWFLMGVRSPSYEAVGLTIPGLPVIALGRSRHIAWGGTNLWALSTAIVRLSSADLAAAEEHREVIRVRDWFDKEVSIRNSSVGPVLSDSPFFTGEPIAISWVGHQPSDELSSYLQIMKARNCNEFRLSFRTWAVSGQNYLCADTAGNIMHVLAYRRPVPGAEMPGLIREMDDRWKSFQNPTHLSYRGNPPSGFLASGNDRPSWSAQPVGYFFSSSSRVDRMAEILDARRLFSIEALKSLQLDTCSHDALAGLNALIEILKIEGMEASLPDPLLHWDGCYGINRSEPVLYEEAMSFLREQLELPAASGEQWSVVIQKLKQRTDRRELLIDMLDHLKYRSGQTWKLKTPVQHPLSYIPLPGNPWNLLTVEEPGASQTIYKRAFRYENGEATVTYGANARHISDLSDPDANYFVLFGGQDGMMKSPTTIDQVQLWKEGRWIRFPLNQQSLEKAGWIRKTLLPAAAVH